jgi:hypothetical protein
MPLSGALKDGFVFTTSDWTEQLFEVQKPAITAPVHLMSEHAQPLFAVKRKVQSKVNHHLDPWIKGILDDLDEYEEPIKDSAILSEEAYWARFYKLNPDPTFSEEIDMDVLSDVYTVVREKIAHELGVYTPVDNLTAMQHMNLSTSPGFPLSKGGLKKRDYLENEGIQKDLSDLIKDLMNPTRDCPIYGYTAHLKDELLLLEKVRKKETRIFIAQNLELVWILNKFLAHFNELFKCHGSTFGSAIGISKYRGGWQELAAYLLETNGGRDGPIVNELDTSNHDGSVKTREIVEWWKLLWRCLSPHFKTSRTLSLYQKLCQLHIHSIVVGAEGTIFCLHGKNKSGQFATSELNTFTLLTRQVYAFTMMTGKRPELFWEYVRFRGYGDDAIWSTIPEIRSIFSSKKVSKFLEDSQIAKTKPAKSNAMLADCHFLSQGFVLNMGIWFSIPDFESSYATMLMGTSDPQNPNWSYLRLAAIRMDAFMNPRFRRLANLVREQLLCICDEEDDDYKVAQSVWISDDLMMRLYRGDLEKVNFLTLSSLREKVMDKLSGAALN